MAIMTGTEGLYAKGGACKLRRRQAIVALLMAVFMLLFLGPPALALGFERLPPALASVIVKTGVLVDQVLGQWVTGSDLTPHGVELTGAIAQSVVNTVHFIALVFTWF